jgi:hypothetical protein
MALDFSSNDLMALALVPVVKSNNPRSLAAPLMGHWAVEGTQVLENPKPNSATKLVDAGLLVGVGQPSGFAVSTRRFGDYSEAICRTLHRGSCGRCPPGERGACWRSNVIPSC